MTQAESVLWSRLRRGTLGARFRRQEPIGPYVVDFVSRSASLVVEVDGDGHGSRWYGDRTRDADLRRWGLRVMRIENRSVFVQLDDVVAEITRLVEDPTADPIWFG